MNLESLPLVVFLLLPGFLSWFIFCWGTISRKISGIQYLFISLLLSIVAFSAAYYVVYLFNLAAVSTFAFYDDIILLPEYMQILADPKMLPLELGIAIYVTAIILGFLLISIYKSGNIRRLLSWIGLDLYGHEDVWYRAFRKSDYVTVYLKDGNIVSGWPTYLSQTGGSENTDLYLRKIHYYLKEKNRWIKPSRSVEGLLLNINSISHIEFRKTESEVLNREDSNPVEDNITSHTLGRIDFLRMGILFYSFGLVLIGIEDWISAYSIAGLLFVLLSLVFMLAGLWEKPRNTINSFIERQRNPVIKSFPKFFEWYILLTLFAVGIAYSLGRLVQVDAPYVVAIYSIGFIWMFVSLIQLRLSLRQNRSDLKIREKL